MLCHELSYPKAATMHGPVGLLATGTRPQAESMRWSPIESTTVSSPFSAYLRSLGPDGEPPTPESFDALLDTLRGALVYEMKRRALWSAPPSYLGIYGGPYWTAGDLLEELLLDCYQAIFLRRLPGLRKQLLVRSNVDGLIFLNIRHFLHDAQKRHDPLGFRIFEIAHAAVVRLLEARTLHVLSGDAEVHNDTVVGFAPWHDPQQAASVDLRFQATAWNDELLPELITAWNREPVVSQLSKLVAGLPNLGVEAFRFRDFVESLKEDVRGRWKAILLSGEGETALDDDEGELPMPVRLVRPEHGFEERQSFLRLLSCMDVSLERIDERKKTRRYLRRLWHLLRQWAAGPDGSPDEDVAPDAELGERTPSDKKLSELLDIPRSRIPGLRATLGRMVEACREAASGDETGGEFTRKTAAAGESGLSLARDQGGPAMSPENRRERLRRATGEAAARIAADLARLAESPGQLPRPGDVFVVEASHAFPVEWVVVEQDAEAPQRLWVAPLDDRPLVGSRDLATTATDGSMAHIRCGAGTWVDAAVFDPELRTGVLGAEALADVLRRRVEVTEKSRNASDPEHEVDADAQYTRWMSLLAEAETALLGAHCGRDREVPESPAKVVPIADHRWRPEAGKPWTLGWGALAAGLAAVLGLALWADYLRRQMDVLAQPIVIRSSANHDLRFRDLQRTPEPFRWTKTASHLGLYLDLSRLETYPAYRLELLANEGEGATWEGRAIWDSGPIASDSELFLLLPRSLITMAEYHVRIYGQDEEGVEKLLDERPVAIESSE